MQQGLSPKPRRRLSCILVSKTLVMFGGFDSEFFNDLNALDMSNLSKDFKEKQIVEDSTKDQDYEDMIDCEESSDFVFRV